MTRAGGATSLQAPRSRLSRGPHRPPRRVGRLALLASAAVHAALLLGLRFDGPRTIAPESRTSGTEPAVMQALSIREVEHAVETSGAVAPPRAARRIEPPVRTDITVDAGVGAAPMASAVGDPARTVTERIAPTAGDRRLWDRPRQAPAAALEPLAGVRARVGDSMAAYTDSVAAAAEASRRAADWTVTRAYGERWGFSPDTVHLGNTRRVLRQCSAGPCQGYLFQPAPGRREAQAGLLRTFEETHIQVRRAELERAFQARVRALRSRNDSVRATRRGGG